MNKSIPHAGRHPARHAQAFGTRGPITRTTRHWLVRLVIMLPLLLGLASCTTSPPSPPPPVTPAPPPSSAPPPEPVVLETREGLASYYHPSLDGGLTASGIAFDNEGMMAAHPTWPMGTLVRVSNLEKDMPAIEVKITDRGPTAENVAEGVIIDLSGAAARQLGMMEDGRVRVKLDVLAWGESD